MNDTFGPLEKRKIRLETGQEIAAIHEMWITERAFPRYLPVPDEGTLGAVDSWMELMDLLHQDLVWLYQLPHHRFWSQVIFSKSVKTSLSSFLQESPPGYCIEKLGEVVKDVVNRLSKVVFLVFCRLATVRENENNYLSPQALGDILYENYIFTVPILMDICAIYGESNREHVARILETVTTVQPKYLEDFALSETHLVKILENGDGLISENGKTETITDVLLHVYDTLTTLRLFVHIFPKGYSVYNTSNLASAAASFYTSVLPKLKKKLELRCLVADVRVECLRIVRSFIENVLDKVINSRSSDHSDQFFSLISEIMSEGLFISDYNSVYPLEGDFDIVKTVYPDMDKMKLDYLLEALSSHMKIADKKPSKKINLNNVVNYASTSASHVPEEKITGVKLASLVSQVQDILPHLSNGFIESCLEYYKYEPEQVIAAVLESRLPPCLEESDWNAETTPVINEDDFLVGHKGKRKDGVKNLNQLLADKTDILEMKDKFASLGFVEDEYDDEFDDTYESQDVGAREPDELEQRRVFVVPRVLQQRNRVVEEEEEEEEEVVNGGEKRDYFVQNPEEVRARAEARRRQATGRDVVGKPKGQGQDKQVLINREKKTVHKSSTGNHHRRDRAARKRAF